MSSKDTLLRYRQPISQMQVHSMRQHPPQSSNLNHSMGFARAAAAGSQANVSQSGGYTAAASLSSNAYSGYTAAVSLSSNAYSGYTAAASVSSNTNAAALQEGDPDAQKNWLPMANDALQWLQQQSPEERIEAL